MKSKMFGFGIFLLILGVLGFFFTTFLLKLVFVLVGTIGFSFTLAGGLDISGWGEEKIKQKITFPKEKTKESDSIDKRKKTDRYNEDEAITEEQLQENSP